MTIKKTILIVDDAPLNIKILNNLLKDKYILLAATSGEKALELLNSRKLPDLILLDVVMPGLSGYEVCKIIKADPEMKSIPVIFISGEDCEDCERKSKEVGGAVVLQKPLVLDLVLNKIKELL